MRQSLRIIEQCLENMPDGPYKAGETRAAPPLKERTMRDIETLIHHFLEVSWGPVVPPGEATAGTEGPKGYSSYYLVSDGETGSYRTRIRTPSFAHLQAVPLLCRGAMISGPGSDTGKPRFCDGRLRPLSRLSDADEMKNRRSRRSTNLSP